MRPPTTLELLDVWEAGLHQAPLETALRLLHLAGAAPDAAGAAALPIGARDARLLQLREWLFGPRLVNNATCPACGEPVEWETAAADLYLGPPAAAGPGPEPQEFTLTEAGYTVRFRLPNSHDMRRAAQQPHYRAPQLLADCVVDAHRGAQACAFAELPAAVAGALNARMAREDPQADIQLRVHCPGCGQPWDVRFDIASYLGLEIDRWARHLLREVAALARAFGWAEHDILRMSPQRRQLYLDLVGA